MYAAYDALIVGAGPAGAAAATTLARGGARVLLLEKSRLPRYKPCGGGLTPRARARSPLAACVPERRATSLALRGPGRLVACELPGPIDMVMRDHFDARLVQHAVADGAELRDGAALTSLDVQEDGARARVGGDVVRARYVIGADGANGVTARLAGFAAGAEPATAIEAEVAVPDRALARYASAALLDFGTVRGGYAWIFGKADHLSVGVYTVDAIARRDLRPALAAFLASHPDLRAARILLRRGHRVPLAGGRHTRRRGPVLLAGDAASLADPLTGEGISYALASGQRAGATVLAALAAGPAALDAYDRFLARDLCGDLRYARLVAFLAYHSPAFGMRLIENHPHMRDLAAAAISGTLDYRTLARHLLQRSPKLLRYLGSIGSGLK
jgi:geranylgeranyl reductase family protein